MLNSTLNVLSTKDIERIHAASLEILEKIGVKFDEDRSLGILKDNGMLVDEKSKVVKFDPDYVEHMIKKAPRTFVMYARDPKNDLKMEKDSVFYATSNAIYKIENGTREDIFRSDLIKYIQLSDALRSAHICVGANFHEAPKDFWDLYEFELMLTNTSKHLRPVIGSPVGPSAVIEMASRVVGGRESLRKRPILSMGHVSVPPLRWSTNALKVFIESAEYNIPVNVESEAITGATSPITLAGTVALANAEVLSGIVFNQMLKEGRPTFYSIGMSHTMDMKTSTCLSATPECFLMAMAGAQIARHYNLPALSWVSTDSKVVDVQAACQKAMGFALHALSGSNLIWGVGSMEMQSGISFEQMMIDNEIISHITRIKEGIEITDETLASDIIEDVGVGGNYLSKVKSLLFTKDYYSKEHTQLEIFDRKSRIDWIKEGRKDLASRAKERISYILKRHKVLSLDEDVCRDLKEIIKKYVKTRVQ